MWQFSFASLFLNWSYHTYRWRWLNIASVESMKFWQMDWVISNILLSDAKLVVYLSIKKISGIDAVSGHAIPENLNLIVRVWNSFGFGSFRFSLGLSGLCSNQKASAKVFDSLAEFEFYGHLFEIDALLHLIRYTESFLVGFCRDRKLHAGTTFASA